MRRKRAIKHGRIVSLVIVGGIGYALGGWNAVTVRTTDISASQTVALRFPQDLDDAVDATRLAVKRLVANRVGTDRFASKQSDTMHVAAANTAVIGGAQLGLLSPNPMIQPIMSEMGAQTAASPAAAVEARVQLASAGDVSLPQAVSVVPAPVQANLAKPVAAPAAAATNTTRRRAADQRPGFVLNDAQIASIKTRLHLSPDQEQMWPGVEAALRNIAYARAREAHRSGAQPNAGQLAATDPNSVEVQGLKSAAIPLLMSFNDEQKDQVRNLAHVMGLDQLASQF
jgi:hypothetical protein